MRTMRPINDIVFKQLFGQEENKDLLLSFLNAVLRLPTPLDTITLIDPHLNADQIGDKNSILDVRAKTKTGEQINIEVQLVNQKDIEKRTLYYWSKMYEKQLVEGELYKNLKKTITINILNFKYFSTEQLHNTFQLYEKNERFLLVDDLEIHTIELPKLTEEYLESGELLAKWLAFLRVNEETELEEFRMQIQEPMIEKAVNLLSIINGDPEKRRLYEMREKAMRDHANIMETVMEKGMEKGIEKGKQEGIEEVVKNMLKEDMEISTISKVTKMPIEDIEKIKSNM